MLVLAAHLPDAAVGLLPVLDRGLDEPLDQRPAPLGQVVAGLRVQEDRVQHRAPHVVLALVVGAVADPHGAGVVVAREVVERLLEQLALALDAVHHLQVVGLGGVLHEVEVVVGLPLEAERVQAPQHERAVANPGVAVVPVADAAGGLGQAGRRRRDHRAGRAVAEALQREGAALQVLAPGVVGEVAVGEPLVPVVGGLDQPVVGVLVGLRAGMVGERERHERGVAVAERADRAHARALESDAQVGRQVQLGRPALRGRRRLAVAAAGVLPLRVAAAVVEDRVALQLDLDRAVDAADRAQQDVVGVVVGRRAAVGAAALLGVVPRADEQHVADDQPAAAGAPARLQDHRAGQIATRGRDHRVRRTEPERPRVAVQQRAEHARAVVAGQAHPLDRAAGSDQRAGLAVRQEAVVRDRRERRDERGIRVLQRHGAPDPLRPRRTAPREPPSCPR